MKRVELFNNYSTKKSKAAWLVGLGISVGVYKEQRPTWPVSTRIGTLILSSRFNFASDSF